MANLSAVRLSYDGTPLSAGIYALMRADGTELILRAERKLTSRKSGGHIA